MFPGELILLCHFHCLKGTWMNEWHIFCWVPCYLINLKQAVKSLFKNLVRKAGFAHGILAWMHTPHSTYTDTKIHTPPDLLVIPLHSQKLYSQFSLSGLEVKFPKITSHICVLCILCSWQHSIHFYSEKKSRNQGENSFDISIAFPMKQTSRMP